METQRIYVIYLTQGYYFNTGVVKRLPEYYNATEARKALILAIKYMEQKSDFTQEVYKPRIRKVVNKNPLTFAREELNVKQFEMFPKNLNQPQLFQ